MSNRLKNKVVILTGASRGIGKGIAKVFADEGARLYLVARHQEALLQCAKELTGSPVTYPCDISNAWCPIIIERQACSATLPMTKHDRLI